jgi:hypothetical protein
MKESKSSFNLTNCLKEALRGIGVDGRQKVYRGMEYQVDLPPKVKIENGIAEAPRRRSQWERPASPARVH